MMLLPNFIRSILLLHKSKQYVFLFTVILKTIIKIESPIGIFSILILGKSKFKKFHTTIIQKVFCLLKKNDINKFTFISLF